MRSGSKKICFRSSIHRKRIEMRLLLNITCLKSDNLTGIERFAFHIAEEIKRIDPVALVTTAGGFPECSDAIRSKLLALSKKNRFEYLARALWDQTVFRRIVHRHKPDVVFFPIQDGMFYPPFKQIVTVHDLHYLHFNKALTECNREIHPIRKNIYHLKMPHILRHSEAIVAVSEATKRDISDSFGIDPDKIHVVYNGYDEYRFRIIDNPQEHLQELGLKSGNYLLFVGSILRHKNIIRLIQAFAELKTDLLLVVVGVCKDYSYLEEIRNTVWECGLNESRFRYLEYVSDEDLPFLYAGAKAFILPSLHEGFGVPIIEAMACGTPVITSNCSAMPEVAGDNALLVDPYSVDAIMESMREILDNPLRAEELQRAGFERVKQFRWSYSAHKLYDLFRSVSDS